MVNNPQSLKIGLLDNSCHSLKRGYELWNEWQKTRDPWLLKEAVIWVHHGTELALKHLLVQTNEFLVFERVDDAVRDIVKLRKQPGMTNAGVLDLFESNQSGAISVGFRSLVQRVALMLNLSDLAEGATLRENIDELTKCRNKLVHFSIEMNINDVSSLLSEILEPLLSLLSREVHDPKFANECIPAIRQKAQPVRNFSKTLEVDSVKRISKLLRKFHGQKVSGELFSLEGDFVLPIFKSVSLFSSSKDLGIDIVAQGHEEIWYVEVKSRLVSGTSLLYMASQLSLSLGTQPVESSIRKAWTVIMSEIQPRDRKAVIERGVMISSQDNITQLERLLFGQLP